MKNIFIVLTLLSLRFYETKAQVNPEILSLEELKKAKTYTNLEEALKVPLQVYKLDLSGQGIDTLDIRIGNLKNLQILDLGWSPRKDCPKKVLKHAADVSGGLLHIDQLTGKYISYNKLKYLPDELYTLKNIQAIFLNYNQISDIPFDIIKLNNLRIIELYGNPLESKKEEILKLDEDMPNCAVETIWSYLRDRDRR